MKATRPTLGVSRVASRDAFTLIELTVVILIIAVLIAILIPAVSGVRDAAKKSDTQGMMNRITQAVAQFQADERRLPGYFSVRDMGDQQNLTHGMSAMENVMLDLVGLPANSSPNGNPSVVPVGPITAKQIQVDTDLFGTSGTGSKQYYVPDPRHYVAQTIQTGAANPGQQAGDSGHTAADGVAQLKDVVDAWGMPLLAWVQDETAMAIPQQNPPVAAQAYVVQTYAGEVATNARFYWASNACFLNAMAAGRGYDQTAASADIAVGGTKACSMMGGDAGAHVPQSTGVLKSLVALVGNPSYPYSGNINPATQAPRLPAAARAPFILESAGRDGYYIGTRDRARKQFSINHLDYEFNTVNRAGGNPNTPADIYYDKDNKPTKIDVLEYFDDVFATTGN